MVGSIVSQPLIRTGLPELSQGDRTDFLKRIGDTAKMP